MAVPRARRHPKELAHATQLLTEHGETKAHFLLTYAQQTAPETAYQPKYFVGILPYLPEALAAYEAQARQAAQRRTQQAAARERRRHERYLAWQQEQCAQLRAALPSAALAALEDRAAAAAGRRRDTGVSAGLRRARRRGCGTGGPGPAADVRGLAAAAGGRCG